MTAKVTPRIRTFTTAFDVILLDQGETFLFENDRFGPDIDYAATYRDLGSRSLSSAQLHTIVARLFDHIHALSRDPAGHENFPTIPEVIRNLPELAIPEVERDRIDDLFAVHELGTIPEGHAQTLRRLAGSHRLGVVSTIWARPARFVANLERTGVRDCFEHLVWSSEQGCIKPARRLFEHALDLFQVPPARVLCVGDNPRRDIDPAKAMGFSAVWVQNSDKAYPTGLRSPDRTIQGLAGAVDKNSADRLTLRQSFTLSNFYLRDDRAFGKNELAGLPRNYYQAELLFEKTGGFYASVTVQAASSYYIDYANTFTVDPYAIYGAKIGYAPPKKGWQVYVQGINLGDRAYASSISPVYNAAHADAAASNAGDGLSVFAGIELHF